MPPSLMPFHCLLNSCPCICSLGLLHGHMIFPTLFSQALKFLGFLVFFMLHLKQYYHLPLFFLKLENQTWTRENYPTLPAGDTQLGSCTIQQLVNSQLLFFLSHSSGFSPPPQISNSAHAYIPNLNE